MWKSFDQNVQVTVLLNDILMLSPAYNYYEQTNEKGVLTGSSVLFWFNVYVMKEPVLLLFV